MVRSQAEMKLQRGWLLFAGGYMLRYSGNARTLDYLNEAEHIARSEGDNVLLAYVHYHRGASRCIRHDVRAGLVELESGINELEALPFGVFHGETTDRTVSILRQLVLGESLDAGDGQKFVIQAEEPGQHTSPQRGILVNWLAHAGYFRRAKDMGELFLQQSQHAYGDEYLSRLQCIVAHLGLGHSYAALGQPEQSRAHFEQSIRSFEAIGVYVEVQSSIWSFLLFTAIPYLTEDVEMRSNLVESATVAWLRSATVSVSAPEDISPSSVLVDVLEGRWTSARQAIMESRSESLWSFAAQGWTAVLAWLSHHQGDDDLAMRCVDEVLPNGSKSEPGNVFAPNAITALVVGASVAFERGDLPSARRWVTCFRSWLDWCDAVLLRADLEMLEVRLHMLAGNLMRALNHAERAVELARHPRQPLALAASLRCLGSINVRLGMYAAAASQFSESLSLADACMAPYERALTLFSLAELEAANGNEGPAELLLDEVRATAVELQAVPLLYRAESLQHTLAEVQATTAVHLLSPRELEVVTHLIEGRSNQEIADSLFISPRTVASHIANIMNKLGVDSRTAVATWAVRQGLL